MQVTHSLDGRRFGCAEDNQRRVNMINTSNLKSSSSVEVKPSDNLFEELGKNSYDYKDLLSELIDNSLAARSDSQKLIVTITILVNESGIKTHFIINDNAKGIPREKLGSAVSPGMVQTNNSLNEHGLGMKQAIAALGKLKYLATRTSDSQNAVLINKLGFGNIDVFDYNWDQPHGTEICVTNLKAIVDTNPTNITRHIVPYLGARYRRYLKEDAPQMEIRIKIQREDTNAIQNEWFVKANKPIYFNPGTRTNAPVFSNFDLSGANWRARFTFGYAPKDDSEYQELGIEKPTKFDPYHVSIKNQGFDIIFHDRVILFHQLSEIKIVETRHNDFNIVRGEIELVEGFQTAITKNLMIQDESFLDLMKKIRDILNGEVAGPGSQPKKYLEKRAYPEEIPEALLRDRLANWLKTNPVIGPKEIVNTEYVVEGIEGYIDILADNDAWELKTGSVSALEVYQLFMYMDVKEIAKGFLIGKQITTGGQVAIDHIRRKHNKTIIFSELSSYPINQPPSREEREEYY